MNRQWKSFPTEKDSSFKNKLLQYSKKFEVVAFYDSCGDTHYDESRFEFMIALGIKELFNSKVGDTFNALQQFLDLQKDWCFGYFGYDLKNEIEVLESKHPDHLRFPESYFFIPEIILYQDAHGMHIGAFQSPELTLISIFQQKEIEKSIIEKKNIQLVPRIDEVTYLEIIKKIKTHIVDGDLYEMNFCQEFYCDGTEINPEKLFNDLSRNLAAPFSVFFKANTHFLICASPERFVCKQKNKAFTYPMKGTMKRETDVKNDLEQKLKLSESEKDKAENIMIVDLVRNDLTKSAKTGTIQVEKLFEVFTFKQAHQMISKISAIIREEVGVVEMIKNLYPMGSMTGAPKIMSMQLIEQYEQTKRGIFSGAFGYFTPEQDCDFNVIIRSIMYHSDSKYISAQVGGAIVFDSIPEMEYEECLLKLKALQDVLRLQ